MTFSEASMKQVLLGITFKSKVPVTNEKLQLEITL